MPCHSCIASLDWIGKSAPIRPPARIESKFYICSDVTHTHPHPHPHPHPHHTHTHPDPVTIPLPPPPLFPPPKCFFFACSSLFLFLGGKPTSKFSQQLQFPVVLRLSHCLKLREVKPNIRIQISHHTLNSSRVQCVEDSLGLLNYHTVQCFAMLCYVRLQSSLITVTSGQRLAGQLAF